MIVGRHPDGRVLLMAKEHTLKPLLKSEGKWGPATISGRELDEFDEVLDEEERAAILAEAQAAGGL